MGRLCLILCIIACFLYIHAGAQGIGVNYGLLGDNLPSPDKVINLLKYKNIEKVRIFDPNPDVLRALGNSGIEVIVGVRNEDLQKLSVSPLFAMQWINTNIIPYVPATKIRYITAGNEVIPGPLGPFVPGAMQNLDTAVKTANILNIPVSTAIHLQTIRNSFPPSNGEFSDESLAVMKPIVDFLVSKQYPLLANLYPYFAYAYNTKNVDLNYALGNPTSEVVVDGVLRYNNMFDAMVDSVYSALEKVGGGSVKVVVSETGWPTDKNGDIATVDNAKAYVNNVLNHVKSHLGTPKRPGIGIETYIFGLFNENLKPAGTEQNFGLFRPDMSPVYFANFST